MKIAPGAIDCTIASTAIDCENLKSKVVQEGYVQQRLKLR